MKRAKFPEPNFEAIIYDSRDVAAADPSSTLGWFATADDAMAEIYKEMQKTRSIIKFEIRDRSGKLCLSGTGA